MRARAASFAARGESPARVARIVAEHAQAVDRPRGALVFVSGELGSRLVDLGKRLAETCPDLPVLVATGHGVLSERGELEGQTAATGVIWSGGEAESVPIVCRDADMGAVLAEVLGPRAGANRTAFVFARPRGFGPHTVEPLAGLRFGAFAGGGTTGDERVLSLMPGQQPKVADAGAMILSGLSPAAVRASPACRLLVPLAPITATRGPMVLEVGGQRALDVLSLAAQGLPGQPLVFVALAAETAEDDEAPPLLLRGIQGVDPIRNGVMVSDEVRPGMRMAFAVRDPAAARADLESTALRLARETGGAAPRFGVYVSCAGRGASLYGSQDVDVRILKSRFPEVPIAGMHSSFEIAPHGGVPALELYTGVLALFSTPS